MGREVAARLARRGLPARRRRDTRSADDFERSSDVLPNAQLRLRSALAEHAPSGLGDYFRLSAMLIRREFIDRWGERPITATLCRSD